MATLEQLRNRYGNAPAVPEAPRGPAPTPQRLAAGRCVFADRETMFKRYDAGRCPACGGAPELWGKLPPDVIQQWLECLACRYRWLFHRAPPAGYDQTDYITKRTNVCKASIEHTLTVFRERPLVGYAIELEVYSTDDLRALVAGIQMPSGSEMVVETLPADDKDESWMRRIYFAAFQADLTSIASNKARVLELSYEALVERITSRPSHEAFKFDDGDYATAEVAWKPYLDWARSNTP